jgi:hypothetical protein
MNATLYTLKARCHYTSLTCRRVSTAVTRHKKQTACVGNLPAVVAAGNPVCPCTGTGWGPSEPPTPASTICHPLAATERWVKLTRPRALQMLQAAVQIAGNNVRAKPVIHHTDTI